MDQTATGSRPASTASTGPRGSSRIPLWLVLFVISNVIFAYMLFFADRAEGPVTQGRRWAASPW